MSFKPILAPNEEPNLEELKYPLLASYKLDGIRCLFVNGEMLSRSLKPIVNKQLREEFQSIADYTRIKNLILDGEIYSTRLSFQEITRYVMTKDFKDKRSVKKFGEVLFIPDHLNFYCFDCIKNEEFMKPYIDRIKDYEKISEDVYNITEKFYLVAQEIVNSAKEVEEAFDRATKEGYEGLILRDFNGKYKCGRGTLREGIIYKVKPYRTFDAPIIGVVQATEVDPNAEKKINELGRSVTSKKKGDRIPIEKASAFIVNYDEEEVKPVLAMTDEEKEEIWRNRDKYIGKWIEYKGMLIG